MKKERWKEIPGYEGLYNGLILSPRLKPTGYYQFRLSKEGKPSTQKASRLVAKTFLPNPENKPTVNHKNGIKNDDRVGNLEWATNAENTQHAYDTGLAHGRKGEKHRNSKLTEPQVLMIRGLLDRGYHWKDLGGMYSVSPMTIRDIKYRKTWSWLKSV